MSILDVYNLLGCGIVVAFLAVVAGILWERRERQNTMNKGKVSQASTATSSHSQLKINEKHQSSGPPSRLAQRMLQKSEKVTSGSPSVYKLPMKVEFRRKESMIARQSIGGGPSHLVGDRTEKVLMVVGQTGAGKTTLINAMVNHILGVEWKDNFRYKVIIEDQTASQGHRQTSDITAYTIYPMEGSNVPYTFTIIDTPGFGDFEGLEKDKTVTDQIKEFLSIPPPEGIDHLDGIGIVTQASLARLSPRQEYIFDLILSMFGKDVAKNIFILVTFADSQQPPVIEAITKANIPSQKYFKFNNSALFAENGEETEEMFDAVFWKMGVRSFKSLFAEFENSESVSLQLTKEVWEEREKVQTLIEQLNQQIAMNRSKSDQLQQEKLVLQQHTKEMEANKKFKYTVPVTKARKIDLKTGKLALTCLKCNYTCCKDCPIGDDGDKHRCHAFDKTGNCKVCPSHCNQSNHKNLPYILEYETVNETRTSEDLKMKYDKAVSLKSQVECAIKKLNEDIQNVDTQVSTMKNQIQQSLGRLDEIALKPNPLTQVQNLERLIGSEKEEVKPGWKKRIQHYEEAKRQAKILSSMKNVGASRLAEDILQKSEKVSSGSPSVYKLPTKIALKRKKV